MNDVTLLGLISVLSGKTQVEVKFPRKTKIASKTADKWFLELSDGDERGELTVVKIDVIGADYIKVEVYYA